MNNETEIEAVVMSDMFIKEHKLLDRIKIINYEYVLYVKNIGYFIAQTIIREDKIYKKIFDLKKGRKIKIIKEDDPKLQESYDKKPKEELRLSYNRLKFLDLSDDVEMGLIYYKNSEVVTDYINEIRKRNNNEYIHKNN